VPALPANTITPRRAIKNYQLNGLINLSYAALSPYSTAQASTTTQRRRLPTTLGAAQEPRSGRSAHALAARQISGMTGSGAVVMGGGGRWCGIPSIS